MDGCGIIDALKPSDAQVDFYEFLQALRLGSRMARKKEFATVKFTYTYRSSDGQRRTAEIEAESRDGAFERVRTELGIKPIKVVAAVETSDDNRQGGSAPSSLAGASPSRGGMFWGTVVVVAILLALGGVWWIRSRSTTQDTTTSQVRQHSADTEAAFKALQESAESVRRQCGEAIEGLNLDLVENYALIERTSDIGFLYEEINKARGVVEWARNQAKAVFRDIHTTFPASRANERLDAQSLYGALMSYIDEYDDRMMRLESALMLLDQNRKKWKCVKGQLVFDDKALEDEYNFFKVEPDADAARWQRDFGDKDGENAVSQESETRKGEAR